MLETRKFGADIVHVCRSKGRHQDATHNSYWWERISSVERLLERHIIKLIINITESNLNLWLRLWRDGKHHLESLQSNNRLDIQDCSLTENIFCLLTLLNPVQKTLKDKRPLRLNTGLQQMSYFNIFVEEKNRWRNVDKWDRIVEAVA